MPKYRSGPRLIPRGYIFDESGTLVPADPDSYNSTDPSPEDIVMAKELLFRAQKILQAAEYWCLICKVAGLTYQEAADKLYEQGLLSTPTHSTVSRKAKRALEALAAFVEEPPGLVEGYLELAIQLVPQEDIVPQPAAPKLWN